jgi:hypothetical protein
VDENRENIRFNSAIIIYLIMIIIMRAENFVAHLDGLGSTPAAHHCSTGTEVAKRRLEPDFRRKGSRCKRVTTHNGGRFNIAKRSAIQPRRNKETLGNLTTKKL